MKSELERKNHSHTLVARECALICHVNQTLYSITLKWKHSPDKTCKLEQTNKSNRKGRNNKSNRFLIPSTPHTHTNARKKCYPKEVHGRVHCTCVPNSIYTSFVFGLCNNLYRCCRAPKKEAKKWGHENSSNSFNIFFFAFEMLAIWFEWTNLFNPIK